MKTIILLDLNYTLVANSEEKRSPFLAQIKIERYRKELIELVKPFYVVLITARPVKYQSVTIGNIELQTGWKPQRSIFNETRLAPHLFKKKKAYEIVINNPETTIIGIESNPRTREEYKKLGILCLNISTEKKNEKKN